MGKLACARSIEESHLYHPLAFEAYRETFYKAPLEYDEEYSGDW